MAIVRKHRVRVKETRRVLPDVFVTTFETLDKPFKYQPGQFLHLALDDYDPSRQWPDSRCFSIQTPPALGARELAIGFSVKGAFTQKMVAALVPGAEIWLKMPYGDLFSQDYSSSDCVFLAGGTGVTPFLSLFQDVSFQRYRQVSLYLGVRTAEYNIYASELGLAQQVNAQFRVSVLRQDQEGLIPVEQVRAEHGSAAVYFLSGPPAMIRAFRGILLSGGVPPDSVKSDDWE